MDAAMHELRQPGLSERSRVILDREIAKLEAALEAREAYERAEPYTRQYGFAPSEVDKNTGNVPELTVVPSVREEGRWRIFTDLAVVFRSWKENLMAFANKNPFVGERELQTRFYSFLESFAIEEVETRQFRKMSRFEAGIVLVDHRKKLVHIVEVGIISRERIKTIETENLPAALIAVPVAFATCTLIKHC
ncbi:MAG: uncharacterized protein A8A55_3019 [Amphiamblys sp. WSBS2006]|nr:MAG: uncharacterized protein A8A55_3019 [Amphiamblys sp. WSBS2006]